MVHGNGVVRNCAGDAQKPEVVIGGVTGSAGGSAAKKKRPTFCAFVRSRLGMSGISAGLVIPEVNWRSKAGTGRRPVNPKKGLIVLWILRNPLEKVRFELRNATKPCSELCKGKALVDLAADRSTALSLILPLSLSLSISLSFFECKLSLKRPQTSSRLLAEARAPLLSRTISRVAGRAQTSSPVTVRLRLSPSELVHPRMARLTVEATEPGRSSDSHCGACASSTRCPHLAEVLQAEIDGRPI